MSTKHMKNNKSKKITPNIFLILHEKAGEKQLHPTIRKMKKLLDGRLKNFLRFHNFVTFRVTYGKALTHKGKMEIFDNQITTDNIDELKLAHTTFLDKDLWLQS